MITCDSEVIQIQRTKLDTFEREVEAWNHDHEEVMLCYSIEDLLREGVDLYDALNGVYRGWENNIRGASESAVFEMRKCMDGLFRRWLGVAKSGVAVFEKFKALCADCGFDAAADLRAKTEEKIERCNDIIGELEVAAMTPNPERLSKLAAASKIPAEFFDEEW